MQAWRKGGMASAGARHGCLDRSKRIGWRKMKTRKGCGT